MNILETYLDDINKNTLKEADPITSSLIWGSVAVAVNITMLLLSTKVMMKEFKDNKKHTNKLNKVLGRTDWKVKVIKEKTPNALTVGNKVVFVTSGLINMMTDRELIAIMLHEAYHIKDLHVYKQLAVQYPLFYIVVFIMCSTGLIAPAYLFFLNILVFNIMLNTLMIPYKITMGRKHEKNADAYSIKFGYSKDMISALNKLERWYKKELSKHKCGVICRTIEKIDEAIDEHPSIKKRVEYILKQKEIWQKIASGKFKIIKNYILTEFGIDSKKIEKIDKGA